MIRNRPKRIISASNGLGLLQVVSELESMPTRTLGSHGRWIVTSEDAGLSWEVDCEIPQRLDRRTKHYS